MLSKKECLLVNITLTLTKCTLFLNFEKIQVLSLYWFAAQKQTITTRPQKWDPFHAKFKVEWIELIASF